MAKPLEPHIEGSEGLGKGVVVLRIPVGTPKVVAEAARRKAHKLAIAHSSKSSTYKQDWGAYWRRKRKGKR